MFTWAGDRFSRGFSLGKKLGAVDAWEFFNAGWDAALAFSVKALPDNVFLMRPAQAECVEFGGPCIGRQECAGTRVGSDGPVRPPRPFPAVGPGPYQDVPNLAPHVSGKHRSASYGVEERETS